MNCAVKHWIINTLKLSHSYRMKCSKSRKIGLSLKLQLNLRKNRSKQMPSQRWSDLQHLGLTNTLDQVKKLFLVIKISLTPNLLCTLVKDIREATNSRFLVKKTLLVNWSKQTSYWNRSIKLSLITVKEKATRQQIYSNIISQSRKQKLDWIRAS